MPLRSNSAFGLPCPCGSGTGYEACCGPLHGGERHAVTAEELMRSRYAAYARGVSDYLFRTWHPRTRPADVATGEGIVWTALEIVDTAAGDVDDSHGEVEFTAHFESGGRADRMHERSRFERRAGRWCYVDGDLE
jgi:SEC-C motif-containing protein